MLKTKELQQALAGRSHRKKDAKEYLAVQTTGLLGVNSRSNNTASGESNDFRKGKESKSEEKNSKEKKSNDPSKPLKHVCLNENNCYRGTSAGFSWIKLGWHYVDC